MNERERFQEEFNPDWVSPPGDTIVHTMISKGITRNYLIGKLKLTEREFELLLLGKMSITPDLAYLLSAHLGGSFQFWISRERNYREGLRRLEIMKKKEYNQVDDVSETATKVIHVAIILAVLYILFRIIYPLIEGVNFSSFFKNEFFLNLFN